MATVKRESYSINDLTRDDLLFIRDLIGIVAVTPGDRDTGCDVRSLYFELVTAVGPEQRFKFTDIEGRHITLIDVEEVDNT